MLKNESARRRAALLTDSAVVSRSAGSKSIPAVSY